MNPMRMLILLAVFWVAGSLLLAAESPQTPQPAKPAATQGTNTSPTTTTPSSGDAKAPGTKASEAKTSDTKATDAKGGTQDQAAKDPKEQRSIAEQAEAALKAAAEADGSAAKPKAEDKSAVDESQPPPGAGKGPSPQRFVPSEQVRADFDVSFPIDI
jgi:cytoskeletal protein RodZ